MTRTVFQVTTEMVEASSTLAKEDIGLWCFINNGRWHGFTSTRSEACMLMSLIKVRA